VGEGTKNIIYRFKDALAEFGTIDTGLQAAVASTCAKLSSQSTSHSSADDVGMAGVVSAAVAAEIIGALKVIFKHWTYHNAKPGQLLATLGHLAPSEATVRAFGCTITLHLPTILLLADSGIVCCMG
jgi:hypothetical protein